AHVIGFDVRIGGLQPLRDQRPVFEARHGRHVGPAEEPVVSSGGLMRRRPSASGPFRELERRGRAGGLDPAQNRAIAGHGQLGLAAASGSRRRSDPLNRELILVNRRAGGGTAAQGGGGDQQRSGTHAREPIDLTASRHLKNSRSFRQNPLTRPGGVRSIALTSSSKECADAERNDQAL